MALTYSQAPALGSVAPDFLLPGVDGKNYSLSDFKNARALLVLFMCNHCPYVVAVQDRINALVKKYGPNGFSLIGINSNDPVKYPDDSFQAMQTRAREENYLFPYVQDETQRVAKAYDAACTPDPYLYENVNGEFRLKYHGRIDDHWKDPTLVKTHDLAWAIEAILNGKPVSTDQKPSMGCNIKWK